MDTPWAAILLHHVAQLEGLAKQLKVLPRADSQHASNHFARGEPHPQRQLRNARLLRRQTKSEGK